jgi:hypothetical protein
MAVVRKSLSFVEIAKLCVCACVRATSFVSSCYFGLLIYKTFNIVTCFIALRDISQVTTLCSIYLTASYRSVEKDSLERFSYRIP